MEEDKVKLLSRKLYEIKLKLEYARMDEKVSFEEYEALKEEAASIKKEIAKAQYEKITEENKRGR